MKRAFQWKDLVGIFKETFKEWSEDKAPRLAAALSYYTIFSLAPLLVMIIGITGYLLGQDQAQERIFNEMYRLTGSRQSAEAVQNLVNSTMDRETGILATIIGFITLLLGATGVFGQLHDALNTIWEVQVKPGKGFLGVIKDRFLSFTLVLGIGFLLLVSLVIDAALSAFSEYFVGLFTGADLLFQIVNFLLSFLVISLLFAMIYKILPDVDLSFGDVAVGAIFTAFLFVIGRELIGLYLGTQAINDTYGAAGSLIVILLWVYYSAQILFFGAEFTQVYTRWRGKRVQTTADDVVKLTEAERAKQGMPHQETVEAAVEQEAVGAAPLPVAQPSRARTLLPATGPDPERALRLPAERPSRAGASLWAFTAILTALVSFISGMVLTRSRKGGTS